MSLNSQIHLYLDSELHKALLSEAEKENTTLSEICRKKLTKLTQLTRIELKLEQVEKLLKEVTDK
jgi:hypothetical protein